LKPRRRPEIALDNPGRYAEAGARRLRPWLERLVGALAPAAASLAVRFTGDREIRRLNRAFRGVDAATDVLSFPGGPTPEGPHLGDLVVSVPTARRQAAARGDAPERELRALLLHGVLHCLGHDHERDGGEMARLERRLRRRWLTSAGEGAGAAGAGEARGA
jgi:probable rRNA maturation factor